MKKVLFILVLLFLSVDAFAQNPEFAKRVDDSINLIKNGKIEEGLAFLIGENSILYEKVFGSAVTKNTQVSQILAFQNAYGKLLNAELVWSQTAGKVTNQWYMLYHENYPMVLDIVFYELDGKIFVIKYKFEETAEDIPSAIY